MVTKKQLLILFLISSKPGVKDVYSLVKLFDKADFPASISENINELLQNNLIITFEIFENGTSKNYRITEKGILLLEKRFKDSEIIQYIKQMDEPKLILEITKTYIERKNVC